MVITPLKNFSVLGGIESFETTENIDDEGANDENTSESGEDIDLEESEFPEDFCGHQDELTKLLVDNFEKASVVSDRKKVELKRVVVFNDDIDTKKETRKAIEKVTEVTEEEVEEKIDLVNSVVINATNDEALEIEKLPEVEKVFAEGKVSIMEGEEGDFREGSESGAGGESSEGESSDLEDELEYDGNGYIVAVIDSGVNYLHKDMILDEGAKVKFSESEWTGKISSLGYGTYLSEKVPFGHNYVTDDETLDTNALDHGYHVAGIVSANGGDDGFTGISKNAQVLDMQIFDNNSEGGYVSDVVKAIEDSVLLGADVINMSLGISCSFNDDSDYFQAAVNEAVKSGVMVVCAAGNDGFSMSNTMKKNALSMEDVGTVNSPGTAKGSIAVASCAGNGENASMSYFSSWGPTNELILKPEVTAPGSDIYSLSRGTSGYSTKSGTSMASPYVAGVTALVKQSIDERNLSLDGNEMEKLIRSSIINRATPIMDKRSSHEGEPYSVRNQGAGVCNKESAVKNTIIVDYNGKNTVELGEVDCKGAVIPVELSFKNVGDSDVTLNFNGTPLYYDTTESRVIYTREIEDSNISSANDEIVIPSHEEKTFTVFLNFSDAVSDGKFVEGFITFIDNNEESLVVPVLGFNGDWGKEDIFCTNDENGENIFTRNGYTKDDNGQELKGAYIVSSDNYRLGLYTEKIDGEYKDLYDDELVAISPTGVLDKAVPAVTFLRGARDVKVEITDDKKQVISTIGNYKYIKKSTWSEIYAGVGNEIIYGQSSECGWNGSFYNDKKDLYETLDGDYFFKVSARVTEKDNMQSIYIPIKVDTKLPEADVNIYEKNNILYMDVAISDNLAVYPYFDICVNGQLRYINLMAECSFKDGVYTYEIGNVKDCYVEYEFMDVAGNLVYDKKKLGNPSSSYEIDENEEIYSVDLSEVTDYCSIFNCNINEASKIKGSEVDEDGMFTIKGILAGGIPDTFKVDDTDVTITPTVRDYVYRWSVKVPIKVGHNDYSFYLANDGKEIDSFSYNSIMYNGNGPKLSLKTGIGNAVGIIKTTLTNYKFSATVESQLEAYDIFVNDKLVISNGNKEDYFFSEENKTFDLSYYLTDNDLHYICVKAVDLCGNVSQKVIKVKKTTIVDSTKTLTNLNVATVNYTKKWTYTGDFIEPDLIITCDGLTLIKDVDYTVTYANNKNIGAGIITVEGMGDYTGIKVYSFKIVPKKTAIRSVSKKKNKKGYNTVKIKKTYGNVRYQVKYSLKKNSGYTNLKKTKKTTFKTKLLQKGKTYYFKVRAYKVIDGVTYTGKWSDVKKVKIKKK